MTLTTELTPDGTDARTGTGASTGETSLRFESTSKPCLTLTQQIMAWLSYLGPPRATESSAARSPTATHSPLVKPYNVGAFEVLTRAVGCLVGAMMRVDVLKRVSLPPTSYNGSATEMR